jgi:hypothetical protein
VVNRTLAKAVPQADFAAVHGAIFNSSIVITTIVRRL